MGEGRAGRRDQLVGSFKRKGLRTEAQVPVNVERVLLLAAKDDSFRERLLRDHGAALAAEGVELTGVERAMFDSLSPEALEAMIRGLAPDRQRNRKFMRKVAATAMVGGMLLASCDDGVASRGMDGDVDADTDSDTDTDTDSDAGSDGGTDSGSDGE